MSWCPNNQVESTGEERDPALIPNEQEDGKPVPHDVERRGHAASENTDSRAPGEPRLQVSWPQTRWSRGGRHEAC